MAKIEITAVIKLIAEAPEDILSNKTSVEDAHHVAHAMFVQSVATMPCPTYKPAVLMPDGTWDVQVEAIINIGIDGEAYMEVPKGDLAATNHNAAHLH